jgi:hypothetical protein
MSYKKLDERGRIHPLSVGRFDVDDNDEYAGGGTAKSDQDFLPQRLSDQRASLSEPLTKSSVDDGIDVINSNVSSRIYDNPADPFYVFREDLFRKLESVDETLAEYLRVVFQTVRSVKSTFFTVLCRIAFRPTYCTNVFRMYH